MAPTSVNIRINVLSVLAVLSAVSYLCVSSESTVYDAILADPTLSQFREALDRDQISKIWLETRTATVFAPTNEAFEKASNLGRTSPDIAPYHIAGLVVNKDHFPMKVTSTKQIAAPLILTTKDTYGEHDDRAGNTLSHSHSRSARDYFVNNAKIIEERRNFRSTAGAEQILYIIDEVMEPFIPSSGISPTANDFLQKQITYDNVRDTNFDLFAELVRKHNLEELFSKNGNHTFFIPLVKNSDKSRLKNLDETIVRAHVIPDKALYLRALEARTEYKTATWDETSQVGVSLPIPPETSSLRPTTNRIQSRTHKATGNHHIGLVRTSVVAANIPVRNGVVHLIEKPFMIVDISIWDFVENNKDGQISQFAALVDKTDSVLTKLRNSGRELTIFAPNNHAFEQLGEAKIKEILENPQLCEELTGLHIVEASVSSEDVRTGKTRELVSLDSKRSLYFQMAQSSDSHMALTVEGGGVNATAIQADIGATNGMVHIIDKVLGIPFQTVYEKLKDDFDLATTYQIGSHRNDFWNKRLADTKKRFTYFAPSKAAWAALKVQMPSEYKQLTEGLLPVHGEHILERHLLVQTDKVIPYDQLLNQPGKTIRTVRGELKVEGTPGEVYITWEGIRAKVTRPDVHSINGVIHVIDHVLMKKRDMTTSGATSSVTSVSIVSVALSLLMALKL